MDALAWALAQNGVVLGVSERFIGPPLNIALMAEGLSESAIASVTSAYANRFLEVGLRRVHPFPSILDMVSCLYLKGMVQMIVSNRLQHIAVRIAEETGLSTFMQAVCGRNDQRETKVDVATRALRNIEHISSRTAVLVGDRAEDVETARILGVASIAVSWGYALRGELQRARAPIASSIDCLNALL